MFDYFRTNCYPSPYLPFFFLFLFYYKPAGNARATYYCSESFQSLSLVDLKTCQPTPHWKASSSLSNALVNSTSVARSRHCFPCERSLIVIVRNYFLVAISGLTNQEWLIIPVSKPIPRRFHHQPVNCAVQLSVGVFSWKFYGFRGRSRSFFFILRIICSSLFTLFSDLPFVINTAQSANSLPFLPLSRSRAWMCVMPEA